MTINFVQVHRQIQQAGEEARREQLALQERLAQAWQALQAWTERLEELRERVRQALRYNASLRCALPWQEALNAHFTAPPPPETGLLLAADGSQANPSRHDRIPFGLINIGLFDYDLSHRRPPEQSVQSELLLNQDLYDEFGTISEERLALERDLRERRALLERVQGETTAPILTLTDGPLELYRQPREDAELQALFRAYLEVLAGLAARGVIVAGYVDKPQADLVVRLLELTLLDDLRQAGQERPLRGVADRVLFNALLQPGERSAILGIQSTSAERFREYEGGQLGLYFFYLNVGTTDQPKVVRVEIPRWVAADAQAVASLHAVLLQQTRITPNRRYPYVLTRAHELALVTYQDRQAVEAMIEQEWRRQGVAVGEESAKQQSKRDLQPPRRRSPIGI
ncbi:DNA double-strand break repair nuclease NurA [uncultured Thermanaerothrix sp.]|uniref:DNA double-strand break repair nuclease NurA n=1 Tax=uncultured Thermanaerothrix sp. TaxID=1195149 RepID=UPI002603DEDE|nr:DNA double-strand break repair nuclease NurA [uncultured Thermanaerothrix sp.]